MHTILCDKTCKGSALKNLFSRNMMTLLNITQGKWHRAHVSLYHTALFGVMDYVQNFSTYNFTLLILFCLYHVYVEQKNRWNNHHNFHFQTMFTFPYTSTDIIISNTKLTPLLFSNSSFLPKLSALTLKIRSFLNC